MENDYEIKYAIAVFNKAGKISFHPLREDSLIGYIVTKVYVVSHEIFYDNGDKYVIYDAVLPYENMSKERHYPEYDKYGNVVNAERIENVYDSYDEAKTECDKMNGKIKFKMVSEVYSKPYIYGLYVDKIDNAAKHFKELMNECKTIETIVSERSKELEITKSKQLNRILV